MIRIRAVRPGDEEAVRSMLSRCSADTLHRRFLTPIPILADGRTRTIHTLARGLCGVRDQRDLVLVALRDRDVVAVAELRHQPSTEGLADVAFLVEDAYQRQGIGVALLRQLVGAARRSGLRALAGDALADNEAMTALFRRAGLSTRAATGAGVSRVWVDLSPAPVSPSGS